MKVVWRLGSVRDVYEALLETRRVAYTTVMTMMNILRQLIDAPHALVRDGPRR